MNIKNVTSLKISKELKEAGFNKDTEFVYCDIADKRLYRENNERFMLYESDIAKSRKVNTNGKDIQCKASLAIEMLEELPDTIEFNKKRCSISVSFLSINNIRNYCVCYENYDNDDFSTSVIRDKSLCDALAKTWIYLKKEKLI